jgi:PAS domain S-box-containing protein
MVVNVQRISLFHILKEKFGDRIPSIRVTKATLVHLSHTLEDIVLTHHLPALIFTGFQESSHWKKETERYRQLAEVAQQVCIFAGKPLPEDSNARSLHIELTGDDPLRQEWFLLILSERFSALLCGLDHLTPTTQEATREFETYWSFEPDLIALALDAVEEAIQHYRADKVAKLREARAMYGLRMPDPHVITHFTREMIRFEETLNRRLREHFAAIVASEERFSQVVASITHHIYVVEIHEENRSVITYLSPNAKALSGYSPEDIQGEEMFWQEKVVYAIDRPLVVAQLNLLRQGRDCNLTYRITRADGEVRWVYDSARVVPTDIPNKWVVYGVMNDVTEQIEVEAQLRLQDQLREALDHERELNAIKNILVSTLSHEVRTPLAAILSASELIERYGERLSVEDYKTRLKIIRMQIQHLRGMLDDISAIIHNETGRIEFKPEDTDLFVLIHDTIEEVRLATSSTHLFTLKRNSDQTQIRLDPRLMKQVMTNLLVNAVKYSPEKSEIMCYLNVMQAGVEITVEDKGIGIPATDLPYIFEPFRRAKNVGNVMGTGLGLKIVKDFVELHHGMVMAESVEGEGTLFTLVLPFVIPPSK